MRIFQIRSSSSFSIERVIQHYNQRPFPNVAETSSSSSSFHMVLPPPNVTGNLHLGHALTVVMEDSICRYQRRIGKNVHWYPGFDHAGIATQTVVERQIFKEKNLIRSQMATEEFLRHCNEWKDERINTITSQLKQTGTSLSWDKCFYTMDDKFSAAVSHAFCQLHSDGFIFRDKRIINWCPKLSSAISDQEVDKIIVDGKEVSVCSRTGDVIQPVLKEQWFLECKEMNKNLLDALENENVMIYPKGNRQKLIDWLNYPEPWCLSRQLVWGHQIPAYQAPDGRWIVSEKQVENSKRDEDVLDTWFSSALIPLVVRGWPNSKLSCDTLPLNLMETGNDIIGFWVARMLVLCRHLSGNLPFNKILLHGLVRDSSGRKMSKSLGNVVDPLDVINGISQTSMIKRLKDSALNQQEISVAEKELKKVFPQGMKAVGPDALRFGLLRHDLAAEDINASIAEVAQEGYRFCNKIWNLVNYAEIVFSKVEPNFKFSNNYADLWILSKLKNTIQRVHLLMDAENDSAIAQPHLAFLTVRDFILHDLCDIYLETTKSAINSQSDDTLCRKEEIANTLQKVLQHTFAVLEPFMPFVSTYLGDKIPGKKFDEINLVESAKSLTSFPEIENDMMMTMALVNAVRTFRFASKIPKKLQLIGYLKNEEMKVLPLRNVLTELTNMKMIDEKVDGMDQLTILRYNCEMFVKLEVVEK